MSRTFRITGGDTSYSVGGQPAMTRTGKEKVGQDLAEAAAVPTDDIGFGFGISELVGQVEDPSSMPILIDSKISNGLNRFIALQQNNQRLVRPDDELLNSIRAVNAGFNGPDTFTDFAFTFTVNTRDGDKVTKRGTAS